MSEVRVGFLGLGTVGAGAIEALRASRDRLAARVGVEIVPVRAAVRDLTKPRPVALDGLQLTTDVMAVATAPDIDIVVEVIGGVDIARDAVRAALSAGKSVVTCNKELIAKEGPELLALAERHGVDLAFEGSVAGGIPILRPLLSSLAGNQITEIVGIINGTTNYILSEMTRTGRPFDELLAEAQAAGYAEADPTDDIEGHDAAYKLAILAMLAFDTPVGEASVYREGITRVQPADIALARRLNYVIKLLGIARDDGDQLELRVHPALVPVEHPLASVNDVFNAIFVAGSSVGQVMFYGRGAGSGPTGSAVVGDLVEVARNRRQCGAPSRTPLTRTRPVAAPDDMRSRYFVRMRVADRPGVLAYLAGILGEQSVSIAQVLQSEAAAGQAEIVWITHLTTEHRLRRSLALMQREPTPVVEIHSVLRCLDGE